MLALLFACCGRRPPPTGECAPLIPPSDDTPQPRVIDHQKLKDRLGSVVRSKEGKMVNVHAHFPFNLQDRPDSSCPSSRNVSGGTLPSSRAPSPSPPRPLQKSPSTTSFPPDADDAPHHLPLAANPSAPILNVRLVKSARTTQSTRGRSQRSGDPNGRAPALDSDPPHDQDAPPPLEVPHLPLSPEAPPYPEDFDIHDAGAVARSWGD